jgi:DNA-binding transcriptional LysR family regulator
MSECLDLLATELTTLLVVAETGSFSLTARRLRIEQSTVSRRVRALEDMLGLSLFERRSHGVELTHAGRAFVDQVASCRSVLDRAILGARQAGAARTGQVRLGFVWSFSRGMASEILSDFRARHPDVRAMLHEGGDRDLIRRLLQDELDCVLVPARPKWDSVLEVLPLWSEALYLISPSVAPTDAPAGWGRLSGETILCRDGAELDSLRAQLHAVQVDARLELHACSLETLAALTASGGGLLILPESLALAFGGCLQATRLERPGAYRKVCAVYRRETDNPVLRRFLAIARGALCA